MDVILLERIEKLGTIGDVVKVKVLEVDRQGRVRLSIKEANAPTEAAAAPAAVAVEEPAAE